MISNRADDIKSGHLESRESPVTQCFRRGRSDNPRYVPIAKEELPSKEASAMVRSESRRPIVFIRESRPERVREQEHI